MTAKTFTDERHQYTLTANSDAERVAAAAYVTAHAIDEADTALLLDALGLVPLQREVS